MADCQVCGQLLTRGQAAFCNAQCRGVSLRKFRTCKHCGKEYRPKKADRKHYCSRECVYLAKAQQWEDSHKVIRLAIVRVCVACGGPIPWTMPVTAEICGDGCRKARARQSSRSISAKKKDLSQRKCKECKRVFVPEYGNKRREFCCDYCMHKHAKVVRIRRVRHDGADRIDPREVFQRDNWMCHMCGKETPWYLRGTTEPNAPELDHLIPLARGGGHTMDNVACCCRECNQDRGAMLIEEYASMQLEDIGEGRVDFPHPAPRVSGGQAFTRAPRLDLGGIG